MTLTGAYILAGAAIGVELLLSRQRYTTIGMGTPGFLFLRLDSSMDWCGLIDSLIDIDTRSVYKGLERDSCWKSSSKQTPCRTIVGIMAFAMAHISWYVGALLSRQYTIQVSK